MKLADLYTALRGHAAAKQGEYKSTALPRGASIAVKIEPDRITVMFGRKGKPLGDVEISIFEATCLIPAGATREPEDRSRQYRQERNGEITWFVRYSWPLD